MNYSLLYKKRIKKQTKTKTNKKEKIKINNINLLINVYIK